jgi:TonB-linked SusC/RagA family outer membrane protein
MKKKWNNMGLLYTVVPPKTMKIMKISVLLMVVGILQISASTFSQTQKLNLKGKSFTLKEIFNAIEDQSDYTVFYVDDQVELGYQLTGDFQNQNITEVLDEALKNTNLTYRISDKLVIILEKTPDVKQIQQGRQITGKVIGADGDPIPGVNVFVEGTTTGTITNIDGEFELTIQPDAQTLVFSFIGFETITVAIGDRANFDVTLMEEFFGLNEVVAIGYGVQKKSDLTGAVASVKSDKLEKVTVSNPVEALQGRLAGVSVTSIGGAPGAGMDIKIRGVNTLNNNSPLVIVDGVPGSMYMLNPTDIESIEVLKDGAAAAIYGTEAANGVIYIRTKKGEVGKLSVDFNAKWGMQEQTSRLQMANSAQYKKVAQMMFDNAGLNRPAFLDEAHYYDTDWLGAVFRTAPIQEYNASFKGGTEGVQYYLSAGWLDQMGTVIGSEFQKSNLRSKIDFTGDWLKGGLNISYNETDRDVLSMDIRHAFEALPIVPVYDDSREDGFGYADIDKGMLHTSNPVGVEYYNDERYTDQYFSGIGYLTFDLMEGLNFRFEAGLNNSNRHSFAHHPSYNVNPLEEQLYPGVYETRTNWREINVNNILSYSKKLGDHSIDALLGYVAKTETSDWMYADVVGYKEVYSVEDGSIVKTEVPTGFLDESFNTLGAGLDGTKSANGSRYTYTRASVLSRLNYSFKDRYLIQATIRRDGSSKFGSESRYGTFPSVALGWRLSEEGFMDGFDFLSNLKLRGSYGVLGNEITLDNYQFLPKITTSTSEYLSYSKGIGETVWLGAISRDLENQKYRWETTTTRNIGLDFGVLNNRLSGAINYYSNLTTDMLVYVPIPPSSGLQTPLVNFGEVKNSGVEIELNYSGSAGEFKYNVVGNFSTTKNEVLKLGDQDESIYGAALNYTEHYAHQTRVGQPIGSLFLYQVDGIFQSDAEVQAHSKDGELIQPNAAPGDIRFKDVDGDGELDDDDKIYSGTGIPKYNYSLSFDGSYKGFDMSVLFYGVGGNKIYNANRYYFESMLTPRNFFATTANAWTTGNTNTDMPRAVSGDPNNNSRESTRFLEDGGFLRVKNIQLGYTLPSSLTSKVKIQKARIYVSGQNLFTITNYSGQDPEVGRADVWSPGLDKTLYPISKMYLFGVQISL